MNARPGSNLSWYLSETMRYERRLRRRAWIRQFWYWAWPALSLGGLIAVLLWR